MNRAKEYHLSFLVKIFKNEPNWKPLPFVSIDADSQGHGLGEPELASFFSGGGVLNTLEIIDEINSFTFDSSDIYIGELSIEGTYEINADVYSNPPRLRFTDYDVPIAHILEILQEWIDFLNSLPYEHELSGK